LTGDPLKQMVAELDRVDIMILDLGINSKETNPLAVQVGCFARRAAGLM
jgi:hypothetical protein